ncbi:DUF551 domain-containing protein [Escherichia coli]|nr:DUF551 domain-containing protein [Escherichia coli]
MTTITRKEQKQVLIDTANHVINRDNTSPYSENLRELARIALASLEAEPVAKIIAHYPLGIDVGKQKFVQAIGELPDFGGYLFAAPPAPIALEAIENAIEYIRSIAFHIDEDDYHGKHIAYFMRQALAWLEGHSCSDDRLGKADNQPVRGNQAAESNRGNEWAGNPDIDNAIIMLDRIDTAESYDDDRIEAVKAVLRRLAGNSPVTPDSWISCSERMPEIRQTVIGWNGYAVRQCVYTRNEYAKTQKGREPRFETSTGIWHGVTHWMTLPEPPKEAK